MFLPQESLIPQDEADSAISTDTDSSAESSRFPHKIVRLREALWDASRSALAILERRSESYAGSSAASAKKFRETPILANRKGKGLAVFEPPTAPWSLLGRALGELRQADVDSADATLRSVYRLLSVFLREVFDVAYLDKQYRASLDRNEARALTQCQSTYKSSNLSTLTAQDHGAQNDAEFASIESLPRNVILRIIHCACSISSKSTLNLSYLNLSAPAMDRDHILDAVQFLAVENDRITRLLMDNNNLDHLPSWVLNFRNLRTLSLNHNPQLSVLPLQLLTLPIRRIHIHKTNLRPSSELPLIQSDPKSRTKLLNPWVRRYANANEDRGVLSLSTIILLRLYELDYLSSIMEGLPPHLQRLAVDICKCDSCSTPGFRGDTWGNNTRGRGGIMRSIKARWAVQEWTTGNRKYSSAEYKGVKEVSVSGRLCRSCWSKHVTEHDREVADVSEKLSRLTMRFHP